LLYGTADELFNVFTAEGLDSSRIDAAFYTCTFENVGFISSGLVFGLLQGGERHKIGGA
jgi:hypothetical protein